ncbi:hypothetical protein GJ496_001567 [Pomphorhynchus laevis]|nr:hypothetical protein GJ496_001567 [Pomphorhynchus laevis]
MIKKDKNRLVNEMYRKESSTKIYMHPRSSHPFLINHNMIVNEALRILGNCSTVDTAIKWQQNLSAGLIKRVYTYREEERGIRIAHERHRAEVVNVRNDDKNKKNKL